MNDRPSRPSSAAGSSTDEPTFEAPWQARAFSLAVALTDETEEEVPSWTEFQSRIVEEIDAGREGRQVDESVDDTDSETAYYRKWLAALERLLVERDVIDPGELADRVESFESGDRDAHEFVDGDPHDHADGLPDGHADGVGHHHHDGPHEHTH